MLALLASGCLGDSEPLSAKRYSQRLTEVYAEHPLDVDGIGSEAIEGLADDARELTEELDELEPPAEVAAPHDRMVSALRDYADHLSSAAEASPGGAMKASLRSAGQSLQSWQDALRQIRRAGYTTFRP